MLILFYIYLIITSCFLLYSYKRYSWKVLYLCLIPLCLLLLIYYCGVSKSYFNEVHNHYVKEIVYEEKWTTCELRTEQVPCGTDSKGNTIYTTRVYHVTESHGPNFYTIDESSNQTYIDVQHYAYYKNLWKNETKIGFHKGDAANFDSPISGNIYQTRWDSTLDHLYAQPSIHKYQNKIRCNSSIFKFSTPSKEDLLLFSRPADNGDTNALHGYGVNILDEDLTRLNALNGYLGSRHQIHILYLLFNSSLYDRSVVDRVLSVWGGPNKNELVIFLGLDSNKKIIWTSVESWMDNTTLHGILKDSLKEKEFDSKKISPIIQESMRYWSRKPFKDFDYLTLTMDYKWYLVYSLLCFSVYGCFIYFTNFHFIKF